MITEFLIWTEVLFIQEVSGVYTCISFFRYRWTKNGLTGPQSLRSFRDTGPWPGYRDEPGGKFSHMNTPARVTGTKRFRQNSFAFATLQPKCHNFVLHACIPVTVTGLIWSVGFCRGLRVKCRGSTRTTQYFFIPQRKKKVIQVILNY